MANGPAEHTDRILTVLETAFQPLEARTSVEENGNVQLRVLDGDTAILIDERPLYGTHAERVAQEWIAQTRQRLEELGYQFETQEAPAAEAR